MEGASKNSCRRFANYYLPDAVNVLEQYAKLARQGVRGENAASIRAEVERNAYYDSYRFCILGRSGMCWLDIICEGFI